jgi:hypothetical protein
MMGVIFMIAVIEGAPNCTAVGIKIRLKRVKHKKHSLYPGCLGLAVYMQAVMEVLKNLTKGYTSVGKT